MRERKRCGDIPESSRFLLKMDYDKLMPSNIDNKTYRVISTEPALGAGANIREQELGAVCLIPC